MRVGILTHHYVANYGAFLQGWCLRETIAELYPADDVRVIDWINRKHWLINTCGYLRFYPKRENLASWLEKNRLPRVFARMRKTRLRLTGRVFSVAEMNALGLDKIVVGSDEVWNYRDRKSYAAAKFGCGVAEETKLISYGASVGGIRDYDDLPAEVPQGLTHFSAFAVRDDNTDAFVRAVTGKTPERVVDPVFLHAVPEGLTPRVRALTAKPYLLFYHCAPLSEQTRAALKAYARERGWRLLGAGEYDKLYDERSIDLDPFEWAELFRHAEHVVTGTFHGAVFSIVNRRPLTVCPNNPTRAEKLRSLLGEFGLSERIVSPECFDLRKTDAEKIDYDAVEARVAERVRQSKDYLTRALG